MSDKKRFAIIDGKSVFYRGYYAMSYLSTKDGTPTGGVFGFATMALEVMRRLKPDYVAVAWDKPKTNIRRRLELYPEYKAGRKPAPPDFYDQIPMLHELLNAFGWPLYELDDYEADDIMGTLAVQADKAGLETMLITSDLDMLQMIDDNIHVYALKTGLSNIELYSPKSFEAKYGIKVNQFLDLKSIKGDSSDNIPGVPGIGEKGAVELLQTYQTLDGIYENIDLIKDSLRKKLVEGRESAYLSKELARIWIDAPIELDLNAVDGSKIKPDQVIDLLEKLEFKSLLKNLPETMQVAIENHKNESGQAVIKKQKPVFVSSPKELDQISLNGPVVFIHSYSEGAHGKDPCVLAFAGDDSTVYGLDKKMLNDKNVQQSLANILKGTKLVGYDVKTTLKALIDLGIDLPSIGHDIQVGAFLIDPLGREKTLSELSTKALGYEGSGFEGLDPDNALAAEPEIIGIIKAIYEQQAKELKQLDKVESLAEDIEWPIIPVLARMEYIGIELNTKYLEDFADEINDLISDFSQQIYGFADQEFNIDSPSQLSDILFNKLGLSTMGIKKGKSGYSTAAKELDKLRGLHPIIDMITQYREVAKLKNTYVDTLPKQVDDKSRLHTTFNMTIAQTGRLSSTDPNLQNIPIRTDLGKRIRTAFVAGRNKKLISADYSQFELRLAAVLAGDTELIGMFNRGADIHAATAAQVYGREQEDITKQMRRNAKVINFGILYGMSPHGLSVATAMNMEQATDFINRYKDLRRPIFDYIERIKEEARSNGFVETMFGRRRPTPDIHSSNFVVRSAAERAAINLPIQGTEADLMKMAMIKIEKQLDEKFPSAHMLLQIHDSILVECDDKDAKAVANLLKDTMETIHKLPVKLDVDVTIGNNWGEL
jgi:DNA polymerase-1